MLKRLVMLLGVLLGTPFPAYAAVEQFSIIGPLQSLKVDPGADPLRGGKMRVNGIEIVLPKNMLIQFPTMFLPLSQVLSMNPNGPSESGLAIEDTTKPIAAFEVSVTGNIVDGVYIAGLVGIAQNSLFNGAGTIKRIDPDGTLIVGGAGLPVGPADTRVKLIDPVGRFGKATTDPTVDKRFAVDDGNPSVIAETGYPMCIPRSAADALCPLSNRPLSGSTPLRLFVMGPNALPPSPADGIPIPACPACSAQRQTPLRVGDPIDFVGVLQKDATGTYVGAFAILDHIGIYTAPGTKPAYVMIEGSLVGAMGPRTPRPGAPGFFLPQETQDRFKIEGMTTDPSRSVVIYAIDVNPVTGAESLRRLALTSPQDAPFGRFRHIVGKRAGVLTSASGLKGVTRELMVRISDGTNLEGQPVPSAPTAANGVVAGQYVAPVGEIIFPENKLAGDPLVPNNFECVAFLQLGSGPLDGTGPVVGRMSPWPGGPAAPTNLFCGP
jgi:hypothetical protein